MDFLLLLKSPQDFYEIIMKKKKEYKKAMVKNTRSLKQKSKNTSIKNTTKYIIELFKLGNRIYLPGRDKYRPVTLVNFQYEHIIWLLVNQKKNF